MNFCGNPLILLEKSLSPPVRIAEGNPGEISEGIPGEVSEENSEGVFSGKNNICMNP